MTTDPVIRSRADHNVSRRDIDPDALRVLYRLTQCGHVAYLVGGGVRDLLLGLKPKDFDVSTDAHPQEIKRLFRNCFLIGRRFRLAHVKFGDKIIETSTFRREPELREPPDDESLYVHRDNTFGTPEEDARRRDFTINGLFYDITNFSIIDHVDGLRDIERRVIRSIGDPSIRFREDPVRMIRAVRFAGRLKFTIEPETYQAILTHCAEIEKASRARLFEELIRLFAFHSAEPVFRLLRETRLMSVLFPEVDEYLTRTGDADSPLWRMLAALDKGSSVVESACPALSFAVLFWPLFCQRVEQARSLGQELAYPAVAHQTIQAFAQQYQIPKAVFYPLIHIITAQTRLDTDPDQLPTGKRRGFSKARFVRQEAFLEALALAELRVAAEDASPAIFQAWKAFYDDERAAAHAHAHADGSHPSPSHPQAHPHPPREGRGRRGRGRRGDHHRSAHAPEHSEGHHDRAQASPQSSESVPWLDPEPESETGSWAPAQE